MVTSVTNDTATNRTYAEHTDKASRSEDLSDGYQRDNGETQREPGLLNGMAWGTRLVCLVLTGPNSPCSSNERPNDPHTIPKAINRISKRITSM